jgi:methylglutaconyl-CoA hydratase
LSYQTLSLEIKNQVARVTLSRPEVKNAFNGQMLSELLEVFQGMKAREDVRVVVFTGSGNCFCAGADLHWMREVKEYTYEENLRESLVLADCLYAIYSCPRPTIARVNGPAIGGGTGMVAVCDIAVASSDAKFSFSEVKIGVVPACISPYVVRKMGEGTCREFFLSGERLTAEKALAAGLVNQVVSPESLDQVVQERVAQLLTSGPEALKVCKDLLEKVSSLPFSDARIYTAEVIARLRQSPEAQEGMAAFLEKRKPKWVK